VTVAHGGEVRTGAKVEAVRPTEGGVEVRLTGDTIVRARCAVLAVAPAAACELLDLPSNAPLARWAAGSVPVKAACLDVALDRLPRPERRFALGLDRPLYYSVHSAAARLAADGIAVIHIMKYLGRDHDPADAEPELEGFLDQLQPGWRDHVVARRLLPGMTVAHGLPRADQGGEAGRPDVVAAERPAVFLAGDWVGPEGLLADASAASARAAAQHALAALQRPTRRRPAHVAS
jgi:phytoene dehydrogenase-like protein